MKINLINRIAKLNGIYNLNPFECKDQFIKNISNKKLISKKFFEINFKNIFQLIIKQLKGTFLGYKFFLKNCSSSCNFDCDSDVFLISYDDCFINSTQDKYFGLLKEKYKLNGRKNISQINIDVYGVEPSDFVIFKVISHMDAIKIIFLSQFIFLKLYAKLIKAYLFKKFSKEILKNYELLNSSSITRLLYWDFSFEKFFKKVKKSSLVIFLLEGSSWEWLLMYHAPQRQSIAGYIHGFAREDQFGMYNLINYFYNYKKLKILVSESWSLNLIKKKTNIIKIYKVENTRYEFITNTKISKPIFDFLILGGINQSLTIEMIEIFSKTLKSLNVIDKYKVMIKFHPNNQRNKIIQSDFQFEDGSLVSIREAIDNSNLIIASGDTAAAIDSWISNKKCYLYKPKKYLDLCPIPKEYRNLLLDLRDFVEMINKLNEKNYDNINLNLPFFYPKGDFPFWMKFIDFNE